MNMLLSPPTTKEEPVMINTKRLLDSFLTYVKIDSESFHEAAYAAHMMDELRALGLDVYQDATQAKTGSETGNVYATLPGNIPGRPILLSAHLDTVVPGRGIEPVVENGVVRSKGDTILGSDDKAGIASLMECLRVIIENDLPHPTIEVVLSVCEEQGLRGADAIEYDKITAKHALVLDSSGDAGVLITSAPGQYKFEASVTGLRAHAGIAPQEGISAIQVVCEAIANMKLLRVDEETTANVGFIHADYPTNIVPETVDITGECRSRNDEKLEAQMAHMIDCLQTACDKYGAKLSMNAYKIYNAYCHSQADPFLCEVADACRKVGLTPVFKTSGGGSDANHFNRDGIKALTLGTGMSKVHTTMEEVTVQNLEDTTKLLLAMTTK